MNNINNGIIKKLIKFFKKRAVENNIKRRPRYIGFLEKLKIPEITKDEACSGLRGLIVVWCFLKDAAEIIKIPNPRNKIKILKILLMLRIYSGKNGLEK